MFILIKDNMLAKIKVAKGEKPWVNLAVKDLKNDLRFLKKDKRKTKKLCSTIYVCSLQNKRAKLPTGLILPTQKEGYTINIKKDYAYIIGYDDFGAMWGIYEFSNRYLGFIPTYLFDQIYPEKVNELKLEQQVFEDAPKKSGLRGWFINDEDYLSLFRYNGGKRNVPYTHFDHVMNPLNVEMVVETALRCKINLVFPSTFNDLRSKDDAKLVKICAKRGIYVSQHHCEPCGVSGYASENYIKDKKLKGTNSFITNRKVMEEIWTHYVKLWAKHERVVYQLGLRGKADQAIWTMDSSVEKDYKKAGAIISEAIKVQYDIVQKYTNGKGICTATFWREAAEMYNKGYLTIPEGVKIVFSDLGLNCMWADDFYQSQYNPKVEYGVYYHAGYWPGQHCCESFMPRKMQYFMSQAYNDKKVSYALLNVGNIKEFTRSILCFSKITWTCGDADLTKEFGDYYYRVFGKEKGQEIIDLYNKYIDNHPVESEECLKAICQQDDYYYHEFGDLPFKKFMLTDMHIRWCIEGILEPGIHDAQVVKNTFLNDDIALKAIDGFEKLFNEFKNIKGLDSQQQRLLNTTFITWCKILHDIYSVTYGFYKMQKAQDLKEKIKYVDYARNAIDSLIEYINNLDLGFFKDWYHWEFTKNFITFVTLQNACKVYKEQFIARLNSQE